MIAALIKFARAGTNICIDGKQESRAIVSLTSRIFIGGYYNVQLRFASRVGYRVLLQVDVNDLDKIAAVGIGGSNGGVMKDWDKIFEYLKLEENAALSANTFAFGRESLLSSNDGAMTNPHVLRTEKLLEEVRAQFDRLPELIAADVTDPAIRWEWARKLYWGPGCPRQQIARHLLGCTVEHVPELVGPSPNSLKCVNCRAEFFPSSQEDWKRAFLIGLEKRGLEDWGPLCSSCQS